MAVSSEEIKKISDLSMLCFEKNELEKITEEMEKIIKFAGEINEFATKENDLIETPEFNFIHAQNSLRNDEIQESSNKDKIFRHVKNHKDGFFYLKNSILKT